MADESIVERLAWKWDDAFAGQEYPEDDPERHEVAKADVQWFLEEIADDPSCGPTVREWLRAQAKGESDE